VNPSVTQSSTGYCCTLLPASICRVTLVAQLQFQQRNRANGRRLVSGAFAFLWSKSHNLHFSAVSPKTPDVHGAPAEACGAELKKPPTPPPHPPLLPSLLLVPEK
jgi:hypothetical protein